MMAFTLSTGSFRVLATSEKVGRDAGVSATELVAFAEERVGASLGPDVVTGFGDFEDRASWLDPLVALNAAGFDCDRVRGGSRGECCGEITTTSRGFGGTAVAAGGLQALAVEESADCRAFFRAAVESIRATESAGAAPADVFARRAFIATLSLHMSETSSELGDRTGRVAGGVAAGGRCFDPCGRMSVARVAAGSVSEGRARSG